MEYPQTLKTITQRLWVQSLNWANHTSIKEGKHFSSLIIHSSNPNEAKFAIRNKIAFQSVLKLAAMSTPRILQCYSCLASGHLAAKCPTKTVWCSHCSQSHRSEFCPLDNLPASCANCLDAFAAEGQKKVPRFNADSITNDDFSVISHSVLSNRCPIRVRASKASSKSCYYPAHDVE